MFGNETTLYALKVTSAVLKLGLSYSPEIVSEAGVPEAYGQKILTKLARAGIVLSRKGRGIGCGIRINPERMDASLSEIFSLFAPPRIEIGANAGPAGRVLDSMLKGIETRTVNLTIGDLKD